MADIGVEAYSPSYEGKGTLPSCPLGGSSKPCPEQEMTPTHECPAWAISPSPLLPCQV